MEIELINLEPTKSTSRLRYVCDLRIDKWLLLRNCTVFIRQDGSKYVRLPVRQKFGADKTIYEEIVKIDKPETQWEFQQQALKLINERLNSLN